MDFALTTEQGLLVDAVRAFVTRELAPHEEAVERDGPVAADARRQRWRL